MLSTAEYMYKCQNALLKNKYLSNKTKEKLFGFHAREYPDVERYYGYG